MNKFNINDYLYYTSIDIENYKNFRPILCIVKKIEEIENGQIIYTVKFHSFIGWASNDRILKQKRDLAEGCLYRDLESLKAVHNKAIHRS